jgi:hypothetical protein
MRTSVWSQVAVLASAGLYAGTATAEFELYNKDGRKLVFNVDLVGAGFVNSNSWFGQSDAFLGDDTDSWFELGVEPRLTFELPVGRGTVFGQLSGVYTNTFGDDASGLTIGLDSTDDITLEQAHIGWKVDDLFSGLEEDTFSIIGGRQDYRIGTGLLIADGGGDGGERGGWYLGMRKAFQESVIARLKSKTLLLEGFRLENNPRSGGTEGVAYGGNLEYTFEGVATLGGSYIAVDANLPDIDVLNVFSGRADWTVMKNVAVSGEYVHETNDQIEADGWYAQVSYTAEQVPWSPVFSYRYAHFDGDDPNTPDDERFREIAYGFTDWGTWYQGEVTGEYALGNGNVNSHMVRTKAQPLEDVTLNLIYYNFTFDEPASVAPGVTSDDWGDEINFIAEWQATEELYLNFVFGALFPGDAAEQFVGGDDDWLYTMFYAAYSW